MEIKANARQGYILKFVLIGLAALVFGGFHLKDAILTAPAMRPHADAYLEMRGDLNENGDAMISDGDLQDLWKEYAEPKGLPITEPKLHDEIDFYVSYNYFVGVIFTLMGLWCLSQGLPAIGKYLELKDDMVGDKSGKRIALADITQIDKTRWEKKGIAKITAEPSSGEKQMIVIDDIKFERGPTDEIMVEIERVAGEDKIVGGKPESAYEELRKEKEAERLAREAELNDLQDDE